MKLYIRFGSLVKFQNLFDSSEYLQAVLGQTRSNVYTINTKEYSEINRLLTSRGINFEISDK